MVHAFEKIKNSIKSSQQWRRAAPVKYWSAVVVLLAILGAAGFVIYARSATVARNIEYPQCEISYGEKVADWDGVVEQSWNERNFHYETRRFFVRSMAPAKIWANVLESPPTRISTGTPDGSTKPCLAEFNNLIDTTKGSYLWQGARPVAARLGMPDLKDTNNQGRIEAPQVNTRLEEEFSPPLYGEDYQKAAAWVDDGGQAAIKPQGGKAKLLWCFNHAQPLGTAEECGEIAGSQKAGAGYLFVEDNCPLNRGIECDRVGAWYKRPNGINSWNITKRIGQNRQGELAPFRLYLDAVSTYGYMVGTWTDITFKYAKITDVSNKLTLDKNTVDPGGKLEVTVSFNKTGPNIKEIVLEPDVGNQPLEKVKGFDITKHQLSLLNKGQTVRTVAEFDVKSNAARGSCYNLGVNFTAKGSVELDGINKVAIPAVSSRYCITRRESKTTYTYDVDSRGNIESSLGVFVAQSAQTLANRLGWAGAGAAFKQVSSGGDFTLVIASPDKMSSFSSGCDAIYSCRAGRYVIINDERWRKATPAWNSAGGTLRDYRHMVVNHEVGHWLGFGHASCPLTGSKAPVMQQQSISLQGCKFNPWPTKAEIDTLKARL